jgi:hypothetical protein
VNDKTTHRGNINLKAEGVKQQWTQEQIDEWVKCSTDPVYFIETYCRIISEDGVVKFQLRDYQREMVETVFHNKFVLIGTARQAGKSTTVSSMIVHFLLFNNYKSAAILANKEATAIEILSKVQLAYQLLPKWLQHGVVEWNKKAAILENGSRVFAAATSSDSIRGYSIDFLFIDEAAHIEGWDAFFTSTFPVISARKQAKIVLVSTPKGMNHFHKLWAESEQGKNDYKRVEVPWHRIPGRDEAWRIMTLAGMGNNADRFAQEYEMQFLGSSGTLIAGWKLKEMVWLTPIYEKEGLCKYKDPIPKHVYSITVDVSEGKGFDYSTFSVIDVTQMPYEQVCTFKNNMVGAPDFAHTIWTTAKLYNDACVLVEVNIALGPEVAQIIHQDLEYEHVLFTANAGARGKKLSSGFGTGIDMGLKSSKTTKATGCSVLKLLIESNQLIINDHATYQELTTFARDTKKSFSAEPGCHDDAVMALVLFAWLSTQNYFQHMTDIHTLSRLREKTDEEMMNDVMPFGFIHDGLPTEETDPNTLFPVSYSWNW